MYQVLYVYSGARSGLMHTCGTLTLMNTSRMAYSSRLQLHLATNHRPQPPPPNGFTLGSSKVCLVLSENLA